MCRGAGPMWILPSGGDGLSKSIHTLHEGASISFGSWEAIRSHNRLSKGFPVAEGMSDGLPFSKNSEICLLLFAQCD